MTDPMDRTDEDRAAAAVRSAAISVITHLVQTIGIALLVGTFIEGLGRKLVVYFVVNAILLTIRLEALSPHKARHMTLDPTLTDEELAQADWLVWRIHEYGASPDDCDKLQRLIAALRASREEVERLRNEATEGAPPSR